MPELLRTPLYDEHKKLGARLVPFAGWEMPVQYSGVIGEHQAVRTRVGMFDVSHMGEFFITGDRAEEFLNRVTTNDVTKLTDGACQYTLLCYENGTVVDDLIVSRVSVNSFIAVVNASNIQKDFDWLVSQNKEGVSLVDKTREFGLIAVQGPKSQSVVNDILKADFSGLLYYHFRESSFLGHNIFVMRTGYTGEDGFELMVPSAKTPDLWRELLARDVQPVGLGARDTLRLEVAYSLYGHEISDRIYPLEANLGWIIKLKKGPFVGSAVLNQLKDSGLQRKVVGFEMLDPGIARADCGVFLGDEQVGYVTSGTHSPSLKKSIGLALVKTGWTQIGTEFLVDIRGQKKKAVVVKTPFYVRS
ncbi:MAG: hypothetical protein ACD_62C00348G0009 [uncultured bacterium]|nr:MAG: hypothetical protein ACD_62C00348G0009 [uncultured bacterium]HLD43806.1 glycine cleavage system aminomethyltransferase GcvT [bacterium]